MFDLNSLLFYVNNYQRNKLLLIEYMCLLKWLTFADQLVNNQQYLYNLMSVKKTV